MTDSTPKQPSASSEAAHLEAGGSASYLRPEPGDPIYPLPSGYSIKSIQVKRHNGPLPDPESLARYGSIDPSLPGRIMAMAERGHEAQISREKEILQNNLSVEIIGRMFSLIFAISVLGLSAYALHLNYPKAAFCIVSVLLGGAVYTISSGKEGRAKDKPHERLENPKN